MKPCNHEVGYVLQGVGLEMILIALESWVAPTVEKMMKSRLTRFGLWIKGNPIARGKGRARKNHWQNFYKIFRGQ